MLLSFVYIASHPRRVFRFPFLCHVPLPDDVPKSFPVISFADSHSLNSFVSYRYKNFRPSDFPPYLTYPLSFHSLPHSFALTKNAALLFSIDSTLFAKNHPGWEGAALQSQRSKATEHQSLHPGRRQCYHSVET